MPQQIVFDDVVLAIMLKKACCFGIKGNVSSNSHVAGTFVKIVAPATIVISYCRPTCLQRVALSLMVSLLFQHMLSSELVRMYGQM